MTEKTLGNSDINGTKQNVPDVQTFGDGDTFQLICKASSQAEGWMKSTKAMEIAGVGCVVQMETQQKNLDGSYSLSMAAVFVPGVAISAMVLNGDPVGRKLVADEYEPFYPEGPALRLCALS